MVKEKTYEEFIAEKEAVRKAIKSIPPVEECPECKHYKKDEEKHVIYYDTKSNMDGKWDDNLDETIGNMQKIAREEKMSVVTQFNGSLLTVNENMSAQEAKKNWNDYGKRVHEAYKRTDEYKNEQAEFKLREMKKQLQIKKDAEILEKTPLELSNSQAFAEAKNLNNDSYGRGIISFAEDFAKLMQHEMAKTTDQELTEEIVRDAEARADLKYGMSGATYSFARNLLVKTWKYGEQLGKIEGFSDQEIQKARKTQESGQKHNPFITREDKQQE